MRFYGFGETIRKKVIGLQSLSIYQAQDWFDTALRFCLSSTPFFISLYLLQNSYLAICEVQFSRSLPTHFLLTISTSKVFPGNPFCLITQINSDFYFRMTIEIKKYCNCTKICVQNFDANRPCFTIRAKGTKIKMQMQTCISVERPMT